MICGESFSRNKGYGTDINDMNQYHNELLNKNPNDKELEDRYNIALKYAHYLYFERMIDVPLESNSNESGSFTKPVLTRESLSHSGIEKIVNTITNNVPTYIHY